MAALRHGHRAADGIDTVEKSNSLCCKTIQAGQVKDKCLVGQDEALGVRSHLIDIGRVDGTADRHHGRQVPALRADRRAAAIEREMCVTGRQV